MCEYESEYLIIAWVRVQVRVLVDEYEYEYEYRHMIYIITLPALWGDDPTGLGQRGGSSTAV